MRLKDKVVIITGGANGIGKEAVLTFGYEGAKVVIADFNEEAGEATLKELTMTGGEGIFTKVDVANQISVQKMVKDAVTAYGKIDVLINNAGIIQDALLNKMSNQSWQKVIDINLTGVFHCAQAVIPVMIEQRKGKIINTSSVSGVYGNVGQTNYAAAKAGVIGMTKTWAKEWGPKGINVNAVAPGFIATSMIESVPEKVIERIKQQIPLNRLGKPSDVANAYLFLASDEADYINGTVLHVDGGIMM